MTLQVENLRHRALQRLARLLDLLARWLDIPDDCPECSKCLDHEPGCRWE